MSGDTMSEKRFFIDKIDDNQYAIYDRLKIGYIEPLVYTDWTVGLNYTQSVCDEIWIVRQVLYEMGVIDDEV